NGSTEYYYINFQDNDNILSYLKKEGAVEPNITGGLSNTFRYKNWELNFLITMQAGNKIRKAAQYSGSNYSDLSVFPKEFKNRWVNPGDEATTRIPAIVSLRTLNESDKALVTMAYSAYNNSSERVVDGSFVRMKSISLSYTFPKDVLDALGVGNLSLRLQSSNPFLIYAHKDLNGQDPEFFRSGGVSYPITPQYTFTINLGI
ncbi:MAG: SusC/RagA family TonB-linked outer membrane protein, partial [Capnocytophaga sp.]